MSRKQPPASDPIDLAAQALRHRDRSRRQIDERLPRAGVADGRPADALDALESIGYVGAAPFGGHRGAALAERGYGDEAISAFLAADGISQDLVDEAVGALRPEAKR